MKFKPSRNQTVPSIFQLQRNELADMKNYSINHEMSECCNNSLAPLIVYYTSKPNLLVFDFLRNNVSFQFQNCICRILKKWSTTVFTTVTKITIVLATISKSYTFLVIWFSWKALCYSWNKVDTHYVKSFRCGELWLSK